jgi:hypothetical protein
MAAPKTNQKCVCYRRLYTEFEEDFTDFFDDLRAHETKINRRINFFNHKENEVLHGGLRSFNKALNLIGTKKNRG